MKLSGETMKAGVSVALAAVASYAHELAAPTLLLVLAMLTDYASGVSAAWMNRELSSRIGIVGILKKLAYLMVSAVAVMADWLIRISAERFCPELADFCFFGILVMIWLILNECISILENVSRMGIQIPEFLLVLMRRLKNNAEQKGDSMLPKEKE